MKLKYRVTIEIEVPASMVASDFRGLIKNSQYHSHGAFVYLVRNVERKHYKIGTTTNIKSRLKQLQTSSSEKLELVGLIMGDLKTEDEIHFYLNKYRLVGEWFRSSREMFWLFNLKEKDFSSIHQLESPGNLKELIAAWRMSQETQSNLN